ncbi:hypothetical protein [Hominenteromicrobium sp.]|uniref:hypothetical protein n=1 Tax=Hominenteromicrobium sp. TaxID=3073581 RepID=UPI00399BF097
MVALLSVVVFGIMLPDHQALQGYSKPAGFRFEPTRENLNGARVIRAFCGEDTETEEFIGQNSLLSKLRNPRAVSPPFADPVAFILINVGIVSAHPLRRCSGQHRHFDAGSGRGAVTS